MALRHQELCTLGGPYVLTGVMHCLGRGGTYEWGFLHHGSAVKPTAMLSRGAGNADKLGSMPLHRCRPHKW